MIWQPPRGYRLSPTEVGGGGPPTPSAQDLRAGFARRDITQPLGTPSSLGLTVVVEEIWDPLSATAVVLEGDGQRVALVGMDLCGLLYESHRQIREAVSAASGIPPELVVVNSSHSHSARSHFRSAGRRSATPSIGWPSR